MMRVAMIALLLAGCSREPTIIDGSTPESFAETTEQARRDLPIKDRLTFDAALRSIGGRRHADNDPEATARNLYDGMTADDVVADARARGIE